MGTDGFIDGNGTVFDEFKWGEAADFGHEEDGGEFAFEVANVSIDVFGDVFDGFGFDIGTHEFGFGAKNCAFIFKLGELQVKGAGPGETGGEAFVDGFDLTGEAIGSDDDLFIELVQVIEDVEEFFLGFLFADNELEIVDDEDVEFAEFEIEFVAFAKADGINEVGVEVGDGGVEDFEGRVFAEKFVADGLDEMGFAEARATIEEEWVVAFAWGVDNAAGGGDRKVIIRADDEIIQGVFLIEAGFLVAGLLGRGRAFAASEVSFEGKITRGDFAGADFGFNFGLDFEINGVDFEISILEGSSDDVKVTVAQLLDVERIFDTDDDVAVGV